LGQIQIDLTENYRQIDEQVSQYWQAHPGPSSNEHQGGYDPAKLPSEQGLPPLESELQRVGLVADQR
jgi:hypothetical protein